MGYGYYQQNYQQTPYQPQYIQQVQSVNNQGFNWVSGESGAKSWIVGRGETVLLMDSENPVFYIKSSDAAGMPLPLRIFDYTERNVTNATGVNSAFGEANNNYITREEYKGILADISDLKDAVGKMQKPATRKKEVSENE